MDEILISLGNKFFDIEEEKDSMRVGNFVKLDTSQIFETRPTHPYWTKFLNVILLMLGLSYEVFEGERIKKGMSNE